MSDYSKYVPGRQDMPYAPPRAGGPWQPPKVPSPAPQAPAQTPNGTQLMAAVVVPPWGQPPAPLAGLGAQPPRPGQTSAPHHAPTATSPYGRAPMAASHQRQAPAPAPYAPPAPHAPPAPYAPPAPHAPPAPYAPPAPDAPPAPYAQSAPYAPPAPHGQPAPYAPPTPHGQPAPYAPPTPHGQPAPYAPPAPCAPLAPYLPPAPYAPLAPYVPPAPYAPTPSRHEAPTFAHDAPVPPPQAVGQAEAGAIDAVPTRQAAPGCAHAYPVAVRTPGVIAATKLAFKTLPYALFRFGQASLFSLASALLLCLGIGLTVLLVNYVHIAVGGVALIALGLALAHWWSPFVEHKLFATSCGHVALLTELITKGQIGNGRQGMFAFGRELAATRLGDIETVWTVYGTINDALQRVSNLLHFVDDLLPIDLGPVKRVLHRVVRWAAPYVEGVIVSYGLARGDRDFVHAGADGLCYSLQNAASLFKTALGVLVLEHLVMLPARAAALLVFVPGVFYATYAGLGGDVAALRTFQQAAFTTYDLVLFLGAIFVGIFLGGAFSHLAVKAFKEAFVKPALLTMVMVKFHVAIENQPLDVGLKERTIKANEGLAKLDDLRASLRRAGV
ncbi:MAG: hypothetical protein MUF34_14320 [Polyangiaceae bacterium]|nr:hypothetical protein [Polyangiaceae bacterium]